MYNIVVERKLKIIAYIFFGIIFGVVYYTTSIFNFSVIPELIGSDWLTVNNTGMLAMVGVEWWENHIALITMQSFVIALAVCLSIALVWAGFFALEGISLLGYYILVQRYEKLDIFENLINQSMVSMLTFDYFYVENKNKKILIRFASVLGAHILFFALTPISVALWAIKWITGGIFLSLKNVI